MCTYCKNQGRGKIEHHQQNCPDNPDKALYCYKCLVFGHSTENCRTTDEAYEIDMAAKVQASIRDKCGLKNKWGQLEVDSEKLFHMTNGERTAWTQEELALRRANKKQEMDKRQPMIDRLRKAQGA